MIAVWFSCGAASAVAAKLTIEKYADTHDVRVVNNPIAEEDEDNRRFLVDVERWIGRKVEFATHPRFPDCSASQVWDAERYMSGPAGAPCTRFLKKRARQAWEATNHADYHVMGFTAEERARHDRFVLTERSNLLPVLIDAGLTKQDCANMVTRAGLKLPHMYELGYPNANCPGCVKATSPTYWNLVREKHPEVFASRCEQSRRIGCKLVQRKGERIYLDELLPTDKGGSLKRLRIDCGVFCEEPLPSPPGSAT